MQRNAEKFWFFIELFLICCLESTTEKVCCVDSIITTHLFGNAENQLDSHVKILSEQMK